MTITFAQVDTDNKAQFLEFANYKMPYGKYKNRYLINLPEYYLVWMKRNGWPNGKLGEFLQLAYEIKQNGLEHLVRPLIKITPNG